MASGGTLAAADDGQFYTTLHGGQETSSNRFYRELGKNRGAASRHSTVDIDYTPLPTPSESLQADLHSRMTPSIPSSSRPNSSYEPREKIMSGPIMNLSTEQELMDNHESYHEDISGPEAEFRLRQFPKPCYLTRYSTATKQYRLSVCRSVARRGELTDDVRHYLIEFKHEGQDKHYKIMDRVFPSLREMLEHYQENRIDHGNPNIGTCITKQAYFATLRIGPPRDETPDGSVPPQVIGPANPAPAAGPELNQPPEANRNRRCNIA